MLAKCDAKLGSNPSLPHLFFETVSLTNGFSTISDISIISEEYYHKEGLECAVISSLKQLVFNQYHQDAYRLKNPHKATRHNFSLNILAPFFQTFWREMGKKFCSELTELNGGQ